MRRGRLELERLLVHANYATAQSVYRALRIGTAVNCVTLRNFPDKNAAGSNVVFPSLVSP
jgi:hypothetical protein